MLLTNPLSQIQRDIYIMNVLVQTVERHFLRHLKEIVPQKLELTEIENLAREDGVKEARRKALALEIDVLKESLRALEEIQ